MGLNIPVLFSYLPNVIQGYRETRRYPDLIMLFPYNPYTQLSLVSHTSIPSYNYGNNDCTY